MTVRDLSLSALSLISENAEDLTTYDDNVILSNINILLGECFTINNSIRIDNDKPVLTVIPQLSAMTDDVPYEDPICFSCLPYGLAGKIVLDDDMGKSQYFTGMFVNNCNQMMKSHPHSIIDVYSEDYDEDRHH